MYKLRISEKVDKKFIKISKKNPKQMKIIWNKITEILKEPYRFKLLHGDLKGSKRVHIDSSFVLIYEIDEINKKVVVLNYDHHDYVY